MELVQEEMEIIRMVRRLPRLWQRRLYWWLVGMTEEIGETDCHTSLRAGSQ